MINCGMSIELAESLKQVVSNHEARSGGEMSTRQIADNAHTSHTTIHQIKKGTIKSISIRKALEISKRLGGPTELKELLKIVEKDNPEEAKAIGKKYADIMEHTPMMESNFQKFINIEKYSQIIWAAYNKNHVTRGEILREYGQSGIESVNALIEKNVLKEENGFIKGMSQSGGFIDDNTTYKQIETVSKLCNPMVDTKKKTQAKIQFKSVNQDFIDKYKKEIQDIYKKFNKEADLPENAGGQHIFFSTLFGTFLNSDDNGKEEG